MRALGLALLLWVAAPALANEAEEAYRTALGAFLQGRYEDAASGYKYLDARVIDKAAPTANLAILARDQGDAQGAYALWMKATLAEPSNPFYWNQRGWTALSIEQIPEARAAFREGLRLSSGTTWGAESDFGLGLADFFDGSMKNAAPHLQQSFTNSPYLVSASANLLAEIAKRVRRMTPPELYLKQSLEHDELQPDTARELARAYEAAGMPKAAWLTYKAALDLDPEDKESKSSFDRVGEYISEKPERLLQVQRLARPLMLKFVEPPPAEPMRVGVFSNGAGEPAFVKHLYFMSGVDFKIMDLQIGETTRGKALEQWEITWRPETNVIELHDVQRQLQYTTKQPFRIDPVDRGATLLLKTAEIAEMTGVNVGDRELRGVLEVHPSPYGFQLVNVLGTEEYLFGAVAEAMPQVGAHQQSKHALRAQAILSRTRLELARKRGRGATGALGADVCDSRHCQEYLGLSQEREDATDAVLATLGGKLYRDGNLVEVAEHRYCGGWSDDGVIDRPSKTSFLRSALDFEMTLHGYPDPAQYCEAEPVPSPSWARWTRLVDAETLRARLETQKEPLGRLTQARVTKRSAQGRVLEVEIVGQQGKRGVQGEEAIARLFMRAGLRSTLFTLQPLYKGASLRSVLVWGAGTGPSHGVCIAGAIGQAQVGRKFRQILEHYYPGSEVKGLNHEAQELEAKELAEEAAALAALKKPVASKGINGKLSTSFRKRLEGAKKIRERLRKRAQARQNKGESDQDTSETEAGAPAEQKPDNSSE